jgi:outer membrane protein OmpA-like peptidoglycan-associated protein
MTRPLLYLAVAISLIAGTCLAQSSAPRAATPAMNQPANSAATAGQNSNAVPVTPETVVPNARNGADPFGRPVEPVVPAKTNAPPPVAPNQGQEFKQTVKDVYFDFDRAELSPDDQATLQQDADWLKAHPEVLFTIAGQADPRGDVVYNLFLSDRRALATRDALVKLGVPENQILFAEGWGKLYPVCQQDDETCWREDRRAHLEPWSPQAGPAKVSAASGVE